MRRLSVGLLVSCWAVLGCRTTAVSQPQAAEVIARGATPKDETDHLRLAAEHLDRADEAGAVPHLLAHLRLQPDALMVRAYLGELLMKTGNRPESQSQFERFTRDAAGATGPAKKHLIHVHTRLMELAGQTDDTFGEQLHRGIGLLLLVKQWHESSAPADEALAERTLVQAAQALKRADGEKPNEARVWLYLAEVWYELEQPSSARNAIRKVRQCQPAWTLNSQERELLRSRCRTEGFGE